MAGTGSGGGQATTTRADGRSLVANKTESPTELSSILYMSKSTDQLVEKQTFLPTYHSRHVRGAVKDTLITRMLGQRRRTTTPSIQRDTVGLDNTPVRVGWG